MQVANIQDIGSAEILRIIMKSLVMKKEYNKAEDILFEEMKKNKTEAIYKVGLDFYEELLNKSDEDLKEHNFSKEEILQGLRDLRYIFSKI